MARLRTNGLLALALIAASIAACGDDEPETNPSFSTDAGASPAAGAGGGEPGAADSTGEGAQGGAPVEPSGGSASVAGSAPQTGGAGGSGPEEPPYDCVLHPTSHLEIINACTDAVRIEKHPTLPPIE